MPIIVAVKQLNMFVFNIKTIIARITKKSELIKAFVYNY